MEFLIHEFPSLYSILKARKGPTVGAEITGHALHVLKTLLYEARQGDMSVWLNYSVLPFGPGKIDSTR